jgi:hypothetical protein
LGWLVADRRVTNKVVIAVAWDTTSSVTSDDDVGAERVSSTVCGACNSAGVFTSGWVARVDVSMDISWESRSDRRVFIYLLSSLGGRESGRSGKEESCEGLHVARRDWFGGGIWEGYFGVERGENMISWWWYKTVFGNDSG